MVVVKKEENCVFAAPGEQHALDKKNNTVIS